MLWPRIASRIKKAKAFEFADHSYDTVKAIWELAALGPRYTVNGQCPAAYHVQFEYWALAEIDKATPEYTSTILLIKLNILSGIYRQHFEGPLVLDRLLRHPLLATTEISKEQKLGLSLEGTENDEIPEENRKVFVSACLEAHLVAVADFLMACSSPIMPYKATETLSYIKFPSFSSTTYLRRNPQIHLTKCVRSLVRSQMSKLDQTRAEPPLLQPLVAMLNKNIHGSLGDLNAICSLQDTLVEIEAERQRRLDL